MVVVKRPNLVGNYEDLKDTNQNLADTTKMQAKNQERTDRKLTFRKITSAVKYSIWLTYYASQCLVATVAILYVLILFSPLLFFYNVLKFIEKKWVYLTTGSVAMTGQDTLWLQDTKKNRLIINSVMVLESNNIESVVDGVRTTINRCIAMKNELGGVAYPRLTKCIRCGIFQYFLKEADNFDITRQVYRYDGETPKSHEEMEDLLSRFSTKDLPFDIPSWRFILIKSYKANEVVLLFRMHHGLADGVSLTRFISLIFPDQVFEGKMNTFSDTDRMFMYIKGLLIGARLLLGKLFSPKDQSIIHGSELNGVKKVSWSKPIDLQVIKKIKNLTGTTVNDVMMGCLSMSFHDYFISQGVMDPPDIKSAVPVDVRSPDRAIELENNFSIVSLKLPVSKKHILEQLYATKASMDEVKYSGEAFVMAAAANYSVEYIPEVITNLWNKPISNKHSSVVSNVPGPTNPFTVAGHRVKAIFFWPPQRDLVGIGVGFYSYAGKVSIGVVGDVNCLANPKWIVRAFESKLAQLEKCVVGTNSQPEIDSGIESH